MLDRAALEELYDYTSFTWQTYGNVVRGLPAGALTQPVEGSGWPALRDVLFHVAGGWDGWLRDQAGSTAPLDEGAESATSWEYLNGYRERVRGWMRRILDETSDIDLHRRNLPEFNGAMMVTKAEILGHILLHERGHHGDITTLVSTLGGTPPPIDYLTYVFFKQRASK